MYLCVFHIILNIFSLITILKTIWGFEKNMKKYSGEIEAVLHGSNIRLSQNELDQLHLKVGDTVEIFEDDEGRVILERLHHSGSNNPNVTTENKSKSYGYYQK